MIEAHHCYGKTKTSNHIGKVCHECGIRLGRDNKKGFCHRCRGRLELCFIGAKASCDRMLKKRLCDCDMYLTNCLSVTSKTACDICRTIRLFINSSVFKRDS